MGKKDQPKKEEPKKPETCNMCRGTGVLYFPGVTEPLTAKCTWCGGSGKR